MENTSCQGSNDLCMKTSIGEGGSSLLHERKPYRYTESRLRGEISQSGERPKKVILCFDGGSHKHGANHQSNIEKIHKMLYGTNGSQLCYYQRANFSRPDDFKTCMGDGYSVSYLMKLEDTEALTLHPTVARRPLQRWG